jgi:hypothetical protein
MDLISGYSQGGAPTDGSTQSLGQAARDIYQGLINPQQLQEVQRATQRTQNVLPSVLESLARGSVAQVPGTVGDISSLLRQLSPETMQQLFGNRSAPTTEEVLGLVPRMTPNYQGSESHEMMGGLLSPAMGYFAKTGTIASKPFARALGEKGYNETENLLESLGLRPAVYRQSTPLRPNPLVGTQFEREFMGGLAEKNPVKMEDLEGASVSIMPWDSSSRNYAIKSISNETLPNQVITHGGQDYARDLEHIRQEIAGASNLGIAKRIKDRDAQARLENLAAGGSGKVIHMPVTMGEGAENYSVMPTQVVLGLIDAREPSKKFISELNDNLRNYVIVKKTKAGYIKTQPFKNFKGIDTEEGRMQLYSGEGLDTTAGELRKALIDRTAGLKKNQEYLGFNAEDLVAAITDPSLMGVPKGYIGNTVLQTDKTGMHLLPSKNQSYNTDFTAKYLGSLGNNVPAEIIMPDVFKAISKEMAGKKGDLRNNTLGAIEKRKEGFSQLIDKNVIENYYRYLNENKK